MEFRATVSIRSTPAKIWSLITDVAGYPSWNTTVDKVEGKVGLGEKVTVHPKISPGRGFPVKVVELDPEKRMVWRGGMPIGFLFKGERTFTLTPSGDGAVDFDMHEVFTGLFSPLITKSIPNMQPAFDEFAACLKRQAET